ncbi:MAG: glycosyltransferase family 2 protein [Salinivirgaceae bacterium]|nr:glycosyltransferase family 2 protein [Salinivirgaceae bacterium]
MIVSLGIIALNEEKYLSAILNDILKQLYPISQIDLILIDSMSDDSTKSIMESFRDEYLNQFYNIRVFENPGQWQANGWNVFIDNAEGDTLIRLDAHTQIPNDFVRKIVSTIETGYFDVVGGKRPTILKDNTAWAKTLLEAENALFGSGLAVFRTSDKARYVKSVFHGAYKKEVFEKVGLFNEKLRRTEDNEIHWRIRHNGFKIWYDPTIVSYQYARPTLLKMLKQKYLNGYWIGKTMWICPKCFSLYHFAPLCFVLSLILFSALSRISYIPLFVLVCLYGIFDLFNTAISIAKNKNLGMIILLGIFPMLHITYGLGTLFGLFAFSNKRK